MSASATFIVRCSTLALMNGIVLLGAWKGFTTHIQRCHFATREKERESQQMLSCSKINCVDSEVALSNISLQFFFELKEVIN